MTLQRAIALLMIVLQIFLVAFLFQEIYFAIFISLFTIVALLVRFPYRISGDRRLVIAVAMALPVILEWRIFLLDTFGRSIVLASGLNYAFAQYFLLLQVLQLLISNRGKLSILMPVGGTAVIACSGDMFPQGAFAAGMLPSWPKEELVYVICAFTFLVLAAIYFYISREKLPNSSQKHDRLRFRLSAAVLALSLCLGGGVTLSVHYFSNDIESTFVNLTRNRLNRQQIGFSTQSQLGSVADMKGMDKGATALRIFSKSVPGYLRGRVHDDYDPPYWRVNRDHEVELSPQQIRPPGLPAADTELNVFSLKGSATSGMHSSLEIWPVLDAEGTFFAPLGVNYSESSVDKMTVDEHGNLHSKKLRKGLYYRGYTQPGKEEDAVDEISQEYASRLMQVPDDLAPRIHKLAQDLFQDAENTGEKIAAVVSYFSENYKYEIGIDIPKDEDPLTYFLTRQPPGHCEYFASGAAILLRLGGVPCRYVTGFVASEWNPYGRYWMARNGDAHAWVEAYDPEYGWIMVEATVAEGVPSSEGEQAGGSGYAWDAFKRRIQAVIAAFRTGSIKATLKEFMFLLFSMLARLVTTLPGILALTTFFLVLIVRQFMRRRRKGAIITNPDILALHRMLATMDGRLRQLDLKRGANETLSQFANRISAEKHEDEFVIGAAGWFLDYVRIRYSGRFDEEGISALADALKTARR